MRSIRKVNVCVVGGAGFLGSHLVDHLVEDRNCNVLVVDNLVAGRREFVHPRAEFVHHDITGSEEFLTKLLYAWKWKNSGGHLFVFNYSAFPYVPDSFVRPLHVFNVNANGAIKVINAAQEAGCEGVLQVSSAEIYGEGQGYPSPIHASAKRPNLDEEAPIKPHSTYGAAKAAVDYYCQTAWRERKTPVIALRQFNCCGERETHPYIIPEIIGQLDGQRTFDVIAANQIGEGGIAFRVDSPVATVKLGNNSFRDFLYAGDAVRIAVELLERGSWGEVYNLGSETGIKMYDLAKLIGKLMGFQDVVVEEDEGRKRPWEIWHLQSDNTKIVGCLGDGMSADGVYCDSGLTMLTPLEEALRRTIRWYEENGRRWPWEN